MLAVSKVVLSSASVVNFVGVGCGYVCSSRANALKSIQLIYVLPTFARTSERIAGFQCCAKKYAMQIFIQLQHGAATNTLCNSIKNALKMYEI